MLLIKENAKIIEYSPKNNKVKEEEEYSVLNPLTNSDSPSVKSKGDRLVSAKILTNHKGSMKKYAQKKELYVLLVFNSLNENLTELQSLIKKKKDKTTSYEIIWAEARIPPKIE